LNISKDNNKIIFEVRDSGIGIPEKDQSKLFESFHRGSNIGNISGTGLGLSIVKKCLDLYKGEITVESEVGKGTTVKVSIPFIKVD
jgi:signal transduction histidine kinase